MGTTCALVIRAAVPGVPIFAISCLLSFFRPGWGWGFAALSLSLSLSVSLSISVALSFFHWALARPSIGGAFKQLQGSFSLFFAWIC